MNTGKEVAAIGGVRELLRIAFPLMLSASSQSVLYVIDRMFLTWYSTAALAAALPAGVCFWLVVSIPYGISNYVKTFVSQYTGAQRKDRVASAVWQGVYFSLCVGLVVPVIAPFAGTIFGSLMRDTEVATMTADYFAILCLAGAPFLVDLTLSAFFSGRGQTRTVFCVDLIGVVANILLDYVLIFGVGPIPEMGIQGAAAATALTYVIKLGLYLYLVGQVEDYRGIFAANRAIDIELFRRMVRFGLPDGMASFLELVCFSTFIFLMSTLGTASLAATNLAFNLSTLAFLPLLGIETAVIILVGQRIGENNHDTAAQTTWNAAGLATVYMAIPVVFLVAIPDVLSEPYFWFSDPVESAEIRATTAMLLRFVAAYTFFDALAVVFGGAIRGAGDTRFAMGFTFLAGLLVMVLPTYVGVTYLGNGLIAGWFAITAYVVVLGSGFLLRFVSGHWRNINVIEPTSKGVAVV
ncbi:Multidrug resistance protein NorM [Planctomycetes bacterium Pan216]|uniref:Multidrug-efflux transporter n=1 Tax=Kolteria novifilia TaxID=2527975 RepID=A0A518B5L7_9BACT|nr:Multidrug resistance protein NorM [Planctomycetes bacterium Pan216]